MILRPDRSDEITLPVQLINTSLTLEETGALVIISMLAAGGSDMAGTSRMEGEDMKRAVRSLQEKGVLQLKHDGGNSCSIVIDLAACELADDDADDGDDDAPGITPYTAD